MGLDISIRDKQGHELAYWRNNHELHNFIIQNFSKKGFNNLLLGEKDIIDIMSAVANSSDDSDDFTLCVLGNVLAHIMCHNRKDPEYKVIYIASM